MPNPKKKYTRNLHGELPYGRTQKFNKLISKQLKRHFLDLHDQLAWQSTTNRSLASKFDELKQKGAFQEVFQELALYEAIQRAEALTISQYSQLVRSYETVKKRHTPDDEDEQPHGNSAKYVVLTGDVFAQAHLLTAQPVQADSTDTPDEDSDDE